MVFLEWIAPQEKPFNEVDNKYYYVVWRGDKNDSWYLTKFNNNTYDTIIIRGYKDDHSLMYRVNGYFGIHSKKIILKEKSLISIIEKIKMIIILKQFIVEI
ncbi:hypothetical protein [Spiroplasma endosymbiont of Seladonia tumulorum]|uniref:hypothetical protein n=1 Tax=Spiroplasma endosymbiont of Seladonia tumulorum TaxID=3066321 RepID=UPI0030D34D5B